MTSPMIAAGVDVGTECVKAVVAAADGKVLGRAVAPARGYFQSCAVEVLTAALDDAQVAEDSLCGVGATGFAMTCVPNATQTISETAAHALGAFHLVRQPMTLVNLGGRSPHVITVGDGGRRVDARGVRRCADGIGSFLMFAARHLDVSPPRLEELASSGTHPATVSSYCSVFSSAELLERLREGVTREDIALGCMHSIAERIAEIGGFQEPMYICGGVVEYFPGVLRALAELADVRARTVPEPIFTGALGSALRVFQCQPR